MTHTLRNFAAAAALVLLGTGCSQKPAVPAPDHVVIAIMENRSRTEIVGAQDAPYITSLASDDHAATFTASYGVEHPSQPNYFDLFAGSDEGVGDDYVPTNQPYNTDNLARELMDVGKSFVIYSEDLPSVGSNDSISGAYRRKHNPLVDWMGTGKFQVPESLNQRFASFPTDFSKLPTVCYVVPNQNNDMHDGTIAQGDSWIRDHMAAYIQWAKTHNSLFIITWDEDDHTAGNNIPTIFNGAIVKPGTYDEHITHFSVLRTIEDMYHLRHADSAAFATPITDVWAQ